MACYTRVLVEIEDNELNRKARENLKLPLEGALEEWEARAVKKEAAILKTIRVAKKLAPGAIVKRKNNGKITVTVRR